MSTRTFSDSRHYYHHREKSTTYVFHHFLPQNLLPHRLLQAKRQLQSVCLKKLFVCQYFFRIPVADNPSAGHQNHAIAGFQNHIEIMRCDDFSDVQNRSVYELTFYGFLDRVHRWFIHQNDIRCHCEDRGDRCHLFLTARQLINLLVP